MSVVPALLEQDREVQTKELLNISRFFTRFQIDIADNTLVPNKTTQIDDLSQSSFFNLVAEATFDFHLMVSRPEKHIEDILSLPKQRIGIVLIHLSSSPDFNRLKMSYPELKFGLVLNPEDKVETLDASILEVLSAVQIMTIVPGFQGSSFIKETLIKIEQLRKRGFRQEIMIDGSVNEDTIGTILSQKEKPNVLGVGSYLTKSPPAQLRKRIAFLTSKVESMG